jgi:hypothetical protein
MKLKAVSGMMLTLLMASMVMVLASPISVIAQLNSTTTVYFDPPMINGTVVGQDFTVDINVRDADEISGWQAGLLFDPTVLNCTGFFEGEFLSDVGETFFAEGTINNATGVITYHACVLYGSVTASGDGRLGYVNFTVISPGVSDLHLRDVKVLKLDELGRVFEVATNIIDVYTVVGDTTSHTVVTVSNSTGLTGDYHSGFYDHAFNASAEEISFKVTGPSAGFSNVTIPKELLELDPQHVWAVLAEGISISRTVTENTTHTFLYFTYSFGIHEVKITTRFIPSTILINLSSTSIAKGDSVTISGAIDPTRSGVNVEIIYRLSGGEWASLANVTTITTGNYSHVWAPDAAGTYEIMASWEGDEETLGDVSDVQTLAVLSIYVFEVVWDSQVFYVNVESNSTVSDFYFNQPMKEIGFNVTGLDGTIGFCNVTIPKTLLLSYPIEQWIVLIDAQTPLYFIATENETHTMLYFTYSHTTHQVQIFGTWVIGPPPSVHDVAVIGVVSSVTEVYEGDLVNINVTVRNEGTVTETFEVSTYYDSILIETLQATSLGPHTEITLTFTWTTSGVPEGDYTISAVASTLLGETDTADNTYINGVVTIKKRPAPPVGGKATPISKATIKPELQTPWILLTILLPLVATLVFVKLKKKKQ